uniref:SKP1 component dimerisation domain-containing protein n=1 Tax=Ditylum brightwellii TaxID=49249 RepID=A0A6U3SS37_9STRA|mmetsp:Transcript_1017/g.1284  ORF Transcript_1017/g.1284 Transcript_1017/m.1284 type:complete len:212 (-) Transcript_1017:485-1120(-)
MDENDKIITLISEEGTKHDIPLAAAKLSPILMSEMGCHQGEDMAGDDSEEVAGAENSSNIELSITGKIKTRVLRKVCDFLTHYVTVEEMNTIETPFETDEIRKIVQEWYANFINVERTLVFELVMAANFLNIQPLLRLSAMAVTFDITGRPADEIRTIFNISNDLNDPEEKRKVREENEWAYEAKRTFEEESKKLLEERKKKEEEEVIKKI